MSDFSISKEQGAGALLHIDLLAVLSGHTQEVRTVRFSPDGTLLASAATDGIHLWQVRERSLLTVIPIEGEAPYRIDFSADGNMLVAAVAGSIRVWSTSGEEVAQLSPNESKATEAVFSPVGNLLLSGDSAGRMHVWNAATRRLLCSFDGVPQHEERPLRRSIYGIGHFAFTPDGKRIAMLNQDRLAPVYIWSVEPAGSRVTLVGSVVEPERSIWTVAFSPDGRLLAASDDAQDAVLLFDAGSFAPVGTLNMPGDLATSLAFSPEGRFLATAGGGKGTVWIWDLDTQQMVTSFDAHREGYAVGSPTWTIGGMDWARVGGLIVTSGTSTGTFFDERRQRYLGPEDYTVKLWHVHMAEDA